MRERQQLRLWLLGPRLHGLQHGRQPGPAGLHPADHAAARPGPLRPAAAPPAVADEEDQAGPVSPAEALRAGLREGEDGEGRKRGGDRFRGFAVHFIFRTDVRDLMAFPVIHHWE